MRLRLLSLVSRYDRLAHATQRWRVGAAAILREQAAMRGAASSSSSDVDSDDESDKPCRSSAPYKQLSRAARTIQAGLRPRITRKVKKARFVRAYMTLVHATHGKLTRHVLVHCAAFLIGQHAPPYVSP